MKTIIQFLFLRIQFKPKWSSYNEFAQQKYKKVCTTVSTSVEGSADRLCLLASWLKGHWHLIKKNLKEENGLFGLAMSLTGKGKELRRNDLEA